MSDRNTNLGGLFNIVLVAEGFKKEEMPVFIAACTKVDAKIRRTRPFDAYAGLINILRFETESNVSGTQLTAACGAGQGPLDTRFKVHFCADQKLPLATRARSMDGDGAGVEAAIEKTGVLAGVFHYPLVIVNNTGHGGTGARPAWFTLEPGFEATALHELGHSAFHLADEYENDLEAIAPPGLLITEPNITTAQGAAALAQEPIPAHRFWASLIKPGLPFPATRRPKLAKPVVKAPDTLADEPLASGVTVSDVGLFEGADHRQLNIFRPFADCRMRHHAVAFCPVCEHAIRTRLNAWELPDELPINTLPLGSTTHLFTVPLPRATLGAYDAVSGDVHFFDAFAATFVKSPPDLAAPGVQLPAGCTSVHVFDGPGGPFIFTFSFADQRRTVHRVVRGLGKQIALDLVADTGVSADAPWTSTSLPFVNGQPHVLGYNRFTGEAALTPLSLSDPVQPDLVSWRDPGRAWQRGATHVEAFDLRGSLMVYRAAVFGPRDLQPLLPLGTRPPDFTLSRPGVPDGSSHHLLDQTLGSLRVFRYASISGGLAVDALRLGRPDFDFIGHRRLTPGGLSVLGQGAPVFTTAIVGSAPAPLSRIFAWHHAPTETLRIHPIPGAARVD
jgi:hypothetical protein